ncbi:flagellar basal body-associated FliL family protein [Candidatus Enterovibrio escicola]|uniref:flagellar basal body-associated FliL family protein n=1 Tax=Candidatus Enterovibrio escicola TaxID=1927127 RepID=UPI001237E8D2|nr:flagellar basal body-associated FliL family protein [Candidatus Enterovibrio escacola]
MADEGNETGSGKNKLIIIAVAALLSFSGSGMFFFFDGEKPLPKRDIFIENTEPVNLQAIYVTLPHPFVFNITGDRQQRLVQVKIKLMVRGGNNEKLAKQNLPLVEYSLLTMFAAATVEQLKTPQGQFEIRQQAVETVQAAMQKITSKKVVERVLFTGFVMQ